MSGLEDIAARAAAVNKRPISLRAAGKFAGGFEEKAVKAVLKLTGESAAVARLLAASKERTGKPGVSFPLFHELFPDFPVTLRAGRLKFDYDGVFMQLMNDFARTPMMDAWLDALGAIDEDDDDRALGLIFSWPRIKGCRQMCVIHNAATSGWESTKLMRRVGEDIFAIETLPSFLLGLGVLVGRDDVEDDEAGEAGGSVGDGEAP